MTRIDPPQLDPGIFGLTMRGLEAGLSVGDIATYGFEACEVDDEVGSVLGRLELQRFDAIPVRSAGRVVGVLERGSNSSSRSAGDGMRHLDDSLLVSADEPLKAFIPLLVDASYRLVVRGTHIEGIVTRSDVHKLPVRLLVFALVTHLEMLMAEVIRQRSEGDSWIPLLRLERQKKLDQKRDELRARNLDPPLIELTEFCDKRDILIRLLQGRLEVGADRAKRQLGRIEDLRNLVAHAAGYAGDEPQFIRLVETLQSAEGWIERLSAILEREPAASVS